MGVGTILEEPKQLHNCGQAYVSDAVFLGIVPTASELDLAPCASPDNSHLSSISRDCADYPVLPHSNRGDHKNFLEVASCVTAPRVRQLRYSPPGKRTWRSVAVAASARACGDPVLAHVDGCRGYCAIAVVAWLLASVSPRPGRLDLGRTLGSAGAVGNGSGTPFADIGKSLAENFSAAAEKGCYFEY